MRLYFSHVSDVLTEDHKIEALELNYSQEETECLIRYFFAIKFFIESDVVVLEIKINLILE